MVTDFVHAADLHLFDGGNGGGAPAAGAEAGSQASVVSSQAAPGDNGTPAAAGQENEQTPEQLAEEFQELTKGKYKDAYDKDFQQRFQKLFDQRFKGVKADQERLSSYQPIIDTLSARYGITDGDMGKLSQAIDSDQSLWEEAAEEAGLTVEQYRRVQRMEMENQRLKAAQRETIQHQMAQQQMQVWQGQIQQVQQSYPDFNLEAEMQNPAFQAMLRAGASIQNAYEATHIDQIKAALAQQTAKSTEKKVTDTIRKKGMRPQEVGGAQPGVPLNADLKNSTAKQRAEWAARAERGEQITFR